MNIRKKLITIFLSNLFIGGAFAASVGKTAKINGLTMYFEIHGTDSGTPLVLLHGGGSTIESTYSRALPLLAEHRKIIAIEEQAHGRTSDRKAPVRFETSAEDVAALLKYLKVEKADIFGFSNGASVALQVAIHHPELVHKLVFASSFTKKDGAIADFWQFMNKADFSSMPQALKDSFLKVNPDPAKLRNMHDKDLERMQNFKDVPDSDLKLVQAPTLVVIGDRDIVRVEHAAWLARTLPQARLLVLPGVHGEFLGEVAAPPASEHLIKSSISLIEEFLDVP